jgi:glucose/arabinose dehydrogenase
MNPIRTFALVSCALALAGCLGRGGGSDDNQSAAAAAPAAAPAPPSTPTPTPTPAPTPAPAPAAGAMNLQVAGLAANTEAVVTVAGGGMTQFVTASRTLPNLAPGAYTVTAEPVLTGQSVMAPTAVTQTIQVVSGQTAAATVSYATQAPFSIRLEEMPWAGLNQPIFLASPPNDTTRIFVQERPGRIRVVQNGVVLATPFLDISARVSTQGERGMLSFAFHPQYAQNGWVFVHFNNLAGDIVVERFTVSAANANLADAQSAAEVIRIPHPTFDNHNGGVAQFGPDGMLFISTGDGGGGGDPMQNAQDTRRLLGKLLRLDVSVLPYRIPSSNPYAGLGIGAEEIWALGLRNPWRWSFDRTANRIYMADVGQGRFEEVDVVASDAPNRNYGWPITEASACYPNDSQACTNAKPRLTLPVFEFDHLNGECAITGGYVYRGATITELTGRYFYSDYCAGFVRSFRYWNGQVVEEVDWNVPSVGRVISFGEDANREIYAITASNKIYRIAKM